MYHLTETSSDRRHQEQPLSHPHQLTQWPLKRLPLRLPRPKRPLLQRREPQHNPPQQGPHQRMYYKAYKEHSEELSQGELQEEEEVEVERDPQAAEHQHHLPMPPNNQHNPLKMLK